MDRVAHEFKGKYLCKGGIFIVYQARPDSSIQLFYGIEKYCKKTKILLNTKLLSQVSLKSHIHQSLFKDFSGKDLQLSNDLFPGRNVMKEKQRS